MNIKPVIFGSTGMIGRGVLLECLDSPLVDAVLVINRRAGDIKHPKLKEIVQEDISQLNPIADVLRGYDTSFFCLGVSAVGMTEEAYNQITYVLTTKVAASLLEINSGMTFCYISGKSTDSTEKGSMMWARVKGKTENALLKMPFKAVYMFRPGFILPLKGIRSRTRLYNLVYDIMRPFFFLLRMNKSGVTDTTRMALSMIKTAANGYPKRILESVDINKVAEGS